MSEHSIFGELQSASPELTTAAAARHPQKVPCHGLFGTRLYADEERDASDAEVKLEEPFLRA